MSMFLFFHTNEALVCTICITIVFGNPVPTSQYKYDVTLDNDGKYRVFWDFNETHITFEVHVQTKGYVGFGISPNGNMNASDVVIGWVKDGHTYFSDRHTIGKIPPVIDASKDWFLLHGEETIEGTILKFVRKLDTCDDDDIPIGEQTTRLIYSYHDTDPVNEASLLYHGPNHRGGKSVSLLTPSKAPPAVKNEDVRIMDFRMRNYVVPTVGTTYACGGFELPKLGRKHHLISFEPIITPGNEKYVHHIVFQKCNGSHPDLDGKMAVCAGEERDKSVHWPNCQSFGVWAYGGEPFYFPDHVGYPVGEDGYNFFVVQMHYTNLELISGIIDSSGMRVKMTSHLRQHDASSLSFTHHIDVRQVVPPKQEAFITRGFCAPQCTLNGLNDELKVVAGFQHAHLLGGAITTRHFRNGKELEPLMDDPFYDFNFQQFRPMVKERIIKPGDYFMIECTLNSMGRQNVTYGGLTTLDEMCASFVFAYPAQRLFSCGSGPTFDNFDFAANFTDKTENNLKIMEHHFSAKDWSAPGAVDDFKTKLDQTTVDHYCGYYNQQSREYSGDSLKYIEHYKPFNRTQFASKKCSKA